MRSPGLRMADLLTYYLYFCGCVGWLGALAEWDKTVGEPFLIRVAGFVFMLAFMFIFWPVSLYLWIVDQRGGK